MKRNTGVLLILALLLTILPLHAFAEDTIQTTQDPLWDVKSTDWFYKAAHEAYARGMIQGVEEYGVKKFAPNNPISQNQALVIVLRYLGLEDNVKKMSATEVESRLNQIGLEPSQVPEWSRAYVAYATGLGYVKSRNDALDRDATRLWLSQLLIRVLEKESLALSADMNKKTNFADDTSIPTYSKGYVNTVVTLGLIEGESRDGLRYFNPDGVTSRAVMATLLARMDQHLIVPSNYTKTVVIKELTETEIVFQTEDGGFETLKFNNPIVFKKITDTNSVKVDLRELKMYDLAKIAVRNNEIVFVDVSGKDVLVDNVLTGVLDDIDLDARIIYLATSNGKVEILRYNDPLIIKNEWNQVVDLTELKLQREIKIYLDNADESKQLISEIIVLGNNASNVPDNPSTPIVSVVVGTLLSLDPDKQRITIELDNGLLEAYTYDKDTSVIYKSARFPLVTDLRKGDRIRLQLTNSEVVNIEVLDLVKDNAAVSGVIDSLNEKGTSITIRSDSEIKAYPVADQVIITIEGVYDPVWSNLKVGHKVKLEVKDNLVTKIIVEGDANTQVLKGRYIYADTRTNILTFRNEKGEPEAKEMADNVYVEMEDFPRTLSDLQENMRVMITLKDDKVTRIVLDNKRQGIIKSIDAKAYKMVVTHDAGDVEYFVTYFPSIDLYGVTYAQTSNLEAGQEIQFYLDNNDFIKRMIVSQTLDYTVISVDTNTKTLRAIRNGTVGQIVYNDSVQLIVPGKTNPSWNDLKGSQIKVTFFGKELTKVEKK